MRDREIQMCTNQKELKDIVLWLRENEKERKRGGESKRRVGKEEQRQKKERENVRSHRLSLMHYK